MKNLLGKNLKSDGHIRPQAFVVAPQVALTESFHLGCR